MKTQTYYGECPNCGAMCQPECLAPCDEEWVVCCDCRIAWTLYHDDPDVARDGSEPWRKYRIGEIESFDDWGIPYECKD